MYKLDKGLVQVYTGDGKGKTSAAFGLALRAVGRGLHVYIIQFIKGGFDYGELYVVKRLPNLSLEAFGRGEFIEEDPKEEDYSHAQNAMKLAEKIITAGKHDIVILDEINVALKLRLIKLESVLKLIKQKPKHVELVLTGRHAPNEILQAADLVTDMKDVKHPYREGFQARQGIEY
ncbi:MAG: cob(I)yrinic acid a,c-diamide adenosyltransferase [Candidatus Bathyarchaeota archaeon]|jgi:cob(I)alamin adenosyltransferase